MLTRCILLSVRSPIRRVACRIFRGSKSTTGRRVLPPLEAALTSSEPPTILASFLRSAQYEECNINRTTYTSNKKNNYSSSSSNSSSNSNNTSSSSDLQRVLSCRVSRETLMCACVAAAIPTVLWPPFITNTLTEVCELKETELSSLSSSSSSSSLLLQWRAFAFALVRSIHFTDFNARASPLLALLCATCLAPSVQLGERLAKKVLELHLKESSNPICNSSGSHYYYYNNNKFIFKNVTKAATAFATCCAINGVSEENDKIWLQMWESVRTSILPSLSSITNDSFISYDDDSKALLLSSATTTTTTTTTRIEKKIESNTLDSSWVRCQELHINCLFRTKRHSDVESILLEIITTTPVLLYHMSDTTLSDLFLLELNFKPFMRRHILEALLNVSIAKSKANVINTNYNSSSSSLSPFMRGRNLPNVTRSSTLFAKVLHALVLQARDEPSVSNCSQILRDIHGLCRISNSYALAASLVPSNRPLTSIMIATPDEQRVRPLAILVQSINEATELMCDISRNLVTNNNNSMNTTSNEIDECVVVALKSCVSVLTNLFSLCSNRGNVLPHRRAEPEWRRRLQRETAVRSHKYELLCSELPHSILTHCLSTILSNGFVLDGGDLGGCLAISDFIDLHFYSLGLLALLYHATRTINHQRPESVKIIRSLYERRRAVFGEDLPVLNTHTTVKSPSNDLQICNNTTAAVVQYGYNNWSETGIRLLHARSTVAAGGSIVIDGSFGVWLRKASAIVSRY